MNELDRVRDEIERTVANLRLLREKERELQKPEPYLVVSRIQLKKYVEIWLDLYRRQGYLVSGSRALAEQSHVSEKTIKNILGQNGYSHPNTQLTIADKLLQAMNMTHVLHELDVYELAPKSPEIPEPPFSHFEEE